MGIFNLFCRSTSRKKPSLQAVQEALERLTEDEALTSGVEDEAAQVLLKWAKEQIQHWHEHTPPQDFDSFNAQLRLILRSSSQLAAQRHELSEVEFLEQLTHLVGAAFSLPAEEE